MGWADDGSNMWSSTSLTAATCGRLPLCRQRGGRPHAAADREVDDHMLLPSERWTTTCFCRQRGRRPHVAAIREVDDHMLLPSERWTTTCCCRQRGGRQHVAAVREVDDHMLLS